MSEIKLKIAVISDLHCHPSAANGGVPCTYLLTDKLRYPTKDHPIESLRGIADDDEITVDLTLCPGDFTDKANTQGFVSGWDFSLEINNILKSKEIIATVGNHDVDVYKTNSNYSLTNAKGIRKNFPIKTESLRDIFWSKGCVFVEEEMYRILVINSSHFHYDKESSMDGKISDEAIEYIQNYLKGLNDNKIQIAMSHHPPIAHPRNNLGEDDKITGGHTLLNLLGKNKFDLFIYGHKHDPFIKYHTTSEDNNIITLFSSGSFSASSNLMFTSTRNAFHVIELSKKASKCKGVINTWTYLPNDGWTKNFDESAFAPISGFGNEKNVQQIFEELKDIFKEKKEMNCLEISEKIEDINYLIPADFKKLSSLLKENKFISSEPVWKKSTIIYNLNL